MTQPTGETREVTTPNEERLNQTEPTQPLIPTEDALDFAERFPNATDEELWLLRELNETCTETMDSLGVPRYMVIQALDIFREDLEHATAPANGPRPNRLGTVISNRDYAQYPGQTRTAISQLDSLIEEALEVRGLDQQVVRTAVKNYATALDFHLNQESSA
jgi:hypothetical protein